MKRWKSDLWLTGCRTGVIALVCAAAGCGGESSGISGPGNVGNNTGPVLLDAKLETVEAGSVIRSAMLDYYANPQSVARGGGLAVDADVFAAELESSANITDASTDSNSTTRFSDTNIQESGVDESDRVKLDGNVMFALEQLDTSYIGIVPEPRTLEEEVVSDQLSLVDELWIAPQPRTMLSSYELNQENSKQLSRLELKDYPSGMYLHKNGGNRELVLLSSGSFDWAYWSMPAYFSSGKTEVRWVNASDPANLSAGRTLTIDGQMISSRKIGSQLILVTRYHPNLFGIVTPYDDAAADSNREIIESAEESSLTPGYSLVTGNGESKGRIFGDNQCYKNVGTTPVSGNSTETDGVDDADIDTDDILPYYESPSVISIISVDLNTQSANIKSTCFIGQSETVYVSQNALYLATTQYRYDVGADSLRRPLVQYYPPEITTEVHKFRFRNNAAPEFRGSASVSGHLGWYADRKPFRMSEKDSNLRIVTFDENRDGSPVTLNILADGDGATLQTISTLPNNNRPKSIGKPNENLYASRFIGDRAYLVTFRITDPLYVLDVSDPYDPFIAGELELPGYSDYLHPVNDDLLIGLGKDAIPAQGSGWGDGRGAFYQGVKLNLFDVSDPSNPVVADNRVFGKRGSDSPALYQHHSFTWLPGGEGRNARMAIPLSLHDEPLQGNVPTGWSDWTSNKLLKMEVDEVNGVFVDVPDWEFESRSNGHRFSPVNLYNDRSVLDSDGGTYVIHNGSLQYGLWENDAPSSATD